MNHARNALIYQALNQRKPVSRIKTFGWGMLSGAVTLGIFDWWFW